MSGPIGTDEMLDRIAELTTTCGQLKERLYKLEGVSNCANLKGETDE